MSTCETAVGAKQGRAKGNKQESQVSRTGRNGWETSRDGRGKTEGTKETSGAPGSRCEENREEELKGRTGSQVTGSEARADERKRRPSGRKRSEARETEWSGSQEEADERKRKRASRGSHLQGRDGGRRKEIADEAACI